MRDKCIPLVQFLIFFKKKWLEYSKCQSVYNLPGEAKVFRPFLVQLFQELFSISRIGSITLPTFFSKEINVLLVFFKFLKSKWK